VTGRRLQRSASLPYAAAACALLLLLALAAEPVRAGEPDMFASLVAKLGEPERARKLPAAEIARYEGTLPASLLNFWRDHGRGSYQNGRFWICDPQPFGPALAEIFAGDREFDPDLMLVVGYTALGKLLIWHQTLKQVSVYLTQSSVATVPPENRIDPATGKPFSDDFTIAAFVTGMRYYDEPLVAAAIVELGRLDEGEIYGFVPALQLGGTYDTDHLQRMKVVEHAGFLAQLAPFRVMRLTAPAPPQFPYGRFEVVRQIGPGR
jgi:hypothetical protein